MIKEISINRFRCFQKSKFSGFKAVNLIGGQNNCGKTALLESLYLNLSPRRSTIMLLKRFRRESLKFAKDMPERTWNNLFFNLDNDKTLNMVSYDSNGDIYNNIELLCDKSTEQFDEILKEYEQTDDDFVDLRTLFSEKNLIITPFGETVGSPPSKLITEDFPASCRSKRNRSAARQGSGIPRVQRRSGDWKERSSGSVPMP
jgi:AAA15 family ATPase/GTPase